MLKHFGAWSVDAQSYDIAFLHPKSKGCDDDCGTLVCKWCSFETKAQRFDFWQVVKKTQTEQATCIILDFRVPQCVRRCIAGQAPRWRKWINTVSVAAHRNMNVWKLRPTRQPDFSQNIAHLKSVTDVDGYGPFFQVAVFVSQL